jgi:hypothetical protein
MTRGILLAWLAGVGLITWRGVKTYKKPVSPGQYAAASGLYVLLALVAEYEPAAAVATLTAWGFDLAVFLQVLPTQVSGPKASGMTGTTQAKGSTTAGGRG